MKTIHVLIAVALMAISISAFANNDGYGRYTNVGFAYSISFPDQIFVPQGESDNGDGQKFITKNKDAKMLVWGSNNAHIENENITAKAIYGFSYGNNDNAKKGERVTYKKISKYWYVVSGFNGNNIFYEKALLRKSNTQSVHFYIEYPEDKRDIYDPVVVEISKSLKLL